MDNLEQRKVAIKNLLLSPGFKLLEEEIGHLLASFIVRSDQPLGINDLAKLNFDNGQKEGVQKVVYILDSFREELEA